ncbi:hypothetical protein CXG81DRAFT_18214 [Caulochytrium protostelioides]|uniref:Extracellular membrane protein CFEM domain-containing protein n=1 Tax=Caulochytrium protostelioides TaxID=1555241 RepID=A0A4P9WWR5_9FUNG|nr:hypothetical protein CAUPRSCDRAFT_10479 [Caulochytrium protostelioides]RKP02039.1 hypothetical protein CXG81DRAFT_18214 [Caulochytrium protostelioides]|eukprot:RKP02039.1 hypothetical protein CXG81DRAFT_18214 [Caulochytrium protostelioides]
MKGFAMTLAFAATALTAVSAIETPVGCTNAPTFSMCISNALTGKDTPEAACAPLMSQQIAYYTCLCNQYNAVSYCYSNTCGNEQLGAEYARASTVYCSAVPNGGSTTAAPGAATTEATATTAATASPTTTVTPNLKSGAMSGLTGAGLSIVGLMVGAAALYL